MYMEALPELSGCCSSESGEISDLPHCKPLLALLPNDAGVMKCPTGHAEERDRKRLSLHKGLGGVCVGCCLSFLFEARGVWAAEKRTCECLAKVL